jgi:hypothetical protein
MDESQGIYDEDLDEAAQKGANKRRWSKQDIEAEMYVYISLKKLNAP